MIKTVEISKKIETITLPVSADLIISEAPAHIDALINTARRVRDLRGALGKMTFLGIFNGVERHSIRGLINLCETSEKDLSEIMISLRDTVKLAKDCINGKYAPDVANEDMCEDWALPTKEELRDSCHKLRSCTKHKTPARDAVDWLERYALMEIPD